MTSARASALDAVKVGDVIFGLAAGGQEKLLLVYEANESGFLARHITTQVRVEFGRDGKSRQYPGGGTCTIASIAALPEEEYDVVIGLDRKMRTAKEPADFRLSKAEIKLLLTVDEFFKARRLPES